MIKLFIFSLIVIVIALLVTLYLGFPADPGYLLIAFGNYTFETSLFALLVAIAVLYLVVRLLLMLWHWINPLQWIRYGRHIRDKRHANARSKTVDGLLYFTRRNWQSAFNLLNEARDDSDASVINYLAAAYAAYEIGEKDTWTRLLNEAEMRFPSARSSTNYLRALILFKSDQLEQCLAVLEKLRKTSLNDAPLLSLLKDVYIRLDAWDQLEELLPALEKNKLVDQGELGRIQVRLFMERLYAAGKNSQARANTEDAVAAMATLWKKASSAIREDVKVVTHYVALLCDVNAKPEAAKIIEQALSKRWHDSLVILYGEKDFECAPQQILQAESWLKSKPANASLFLTLGRLSMRNELWGKAREYFEASIKISPSASAYGELARLQKQLGDTEASAQNFSKYTELASTALPELPLPQTR